jgi:long-chain acyl-CoA synthetase
MQERFTIAGIIRTYAAERPDAEMLVCGDERRSWRQQYERSCRLAHALTDEGVGAGGRVSFLDRNGLAYFDVLFAGAFIGAVTVAVNWRLAPAEIAAVIDDSEATVLVLHREYVPALAAMRNDLAKVSRIVVIDDDGEAARIDRAIAFEDWLDGRPDDDPDLHAAEGDVSMQLYTSGTTGIPKGVMLSTHNLATTATSAGDNFNVDASTVSLVAMPLFHIGGSGWALCGMSRGGRSIILRDVEPVEILRVFETERITETFLVPAVLMFLLVTPALETTDLSSLRNIFYGASPIGEEGFLFLHDRIKDMIVSGGENVYPAEVENVLLAHAAVADAAVLGVPDDRWGEAVKAIVVRAPGDDVTPEEIIEFCRDRLAGYKCPKSVDFADTLPRNPSGKILKRELRTQYWAGKERNIS